MDGTLGDEPLKSKEASWGSRGCWKF